MCRIGGVEIQGSSDGIRCPGELGDKRITSNLLGGSIMLSNSPREALKSILYALVSNCLIELSKRSRADHISVQQYRELAGRFLSHVDSCHYNHAGKCADSIVGEYGEQVDGDTRRYIGT
jgi:hypothetical protein